MPGSEVLLVLTGRESLKHMYERIVAQDNIFVQNRKAEREANSEIRVHKNDFEKQTLDDLRSRMSMENVRANDLAQMKGASSWLTALPLKEEGYVLNKREFFDAVTLRYRWDVKDLPQNCACSKKFSVEHAMICKKGGYIHRRHDRIRDLFADLLSDVSHGVAIEPQLQPLSGEQLPKGSNKDDEARLDLIAKGFWQDFAAAYFDVRVFYAHARCYLNMNLESAFKSNERQKKTEYNARVVNVEHGSFTPIVMSSCGGFGIETTKFVNTLIEKVATKKDMPVSVVANCIRTKVSFELIRSQVACMRGSRAWKKMKVDTGEMELTNVASNIRE